MSIWLKNAAVLTIVVAFTLAANSIANAAEKREQTYVKTNILTAHSSTVQIGEGHELTQEVSISDMKYSNPDFDITREWVYVHTDTIDGNGRLNAYFVDFAEDGSQTYGTAEGTVKTTVDPDGSWQANWEGTYKYLGGTGKFKNIKGEGTFKGRASSREPATEEGKEVVEY